MSEIEKNNLQTDDFQLQRADLLCIRDLIPENAKVLDLGCGSGRLLKALQRKKHCIVSGVEKDQEKILEASVRGVPVVQADLDEPLDMLPEQAYDYVILSRTIQAVRRPDLVLKEMLRTGKKGIVSYINLGHINARVQLMFGNMPVNRNLPLPWYDTPTIHPGTISDFRNLCKTLGIKILKWIPISTEGDFLPFLGRLFPNLFASNCIFIISYDNNNNAKE